MLFSDLMKAYQRRTFTYQQSNKKHVQDVRVYLYMYWSDAPPLTVE